MNWFKNLKISVKLITGFIIVALISGLVGGIGIYNIISLDNSDTELYEKMTVPISEMSKIATAFQRVRVDTRDIILANNSQEISVQVQSIQERRKEIDEAAKEFEKSILSQEVRDAYDEFFQARNEYVSYLDQLVQLARANQDAEANALLNSEGMTLAAKNEQAAIEKLVMMKERDAKTKAENNTEQANQAIIMMVICILVGMVLAVVLGIYISRIISKPINKLVVIAEKVADGDLDVDIDIDTKDEIGILAQGFMTMADNLNEVMSNINTAAEQVASGSKQVSDSSMALSQGAAEQASSIEELTASLEEISAQTEKNAQNANEANSLAETAKINAAQGNDQMKEMLEAMDEINNSSNNISKIIKVIDEIAFQTNILALNAAVEAARAGQHGKGFAVVAEEVRNLAARSANAAKETTDMIEGSIKKVEGGTKIAIDTASALNHIVEGVTKVADLVNDIAIASNEQATGIAQVNQGIGQVAEVVQTNSATSEEGAAASEELASQAELLKEQVNRFKLRRYTQTRSYKALDDLSPEIMKMLGTFNDKRNAKYFNGTETKNEVAVTTDKHKNEKGKDEKSKVSKKIALSDSEFGKY